VLRTFLDASGPQLLELQSAADSGDHAAVSRLAHRLRGAAANLGAEPLALACTELETSPDAALTARLLDSLEDELAAACAEFERVLADRP
jgi:HPt (histidine-containing phosphotransfer) domain-containing protein